MDICYILYVHIHLILHTRAFHRCRYILRMCMDFEKKFFDYSIWKINLQSQSTHYFQSLIYRLLQFEGFLSFSSIKSKFFMISFLCITYSQEQGCRILNKLEWILMQARGLTRQIQLLWPFAIRQPTTEFRQIFLAYRKCEFTSQKTSGSLPISIISTDFQ